MNKRQLIAAITILAAICTILIFLGNKYSTIEDAQIAEIEYPSEYPLQGTIEPYSPNEDYQYLLMTLVGECHYCELEFQLMVGSVVLNRVADPDFKGDCIKDIVTAPKQYQCFVDGNAFREPTETNKRAVEFLLENGSILPANVVYQAEFQQGSGIYDKVGNTYFCFK